MCSAKARLEPQGAMQAPPLPLPDTRRWPPIHARNGLTAHKRTAKWPLSDITLCGIATSFNSGPMNTCDICA